MKKILLTLMTSFISISLLIGCTNTNDSTISTDTNSLPISEDDQTTTDSSTTNTTTNTILKNETDTVQTVSTQSSILPTVKLKDVDLSNAKYLELNNEIVTITDSGVYSLSGTIEEGQIIVNVTSEDNVTLVLNNVNITSSTTSPIYIENAKNVILVLAENSINTLTDNRENNELLEETDTDIPTAALFSHDDLIILGNGTLNIFANYNDGIASKDDLTIESGSINITSQGDGIVGKDSVHILSPNIQINANAHGIKSTNTEDTEKGYILVDGATITIDSGIDGFNSNNAIYIVSGTILIQAEDDGIHANANLIIYDGSLDITQSYEGLESLVITIQNGQLNIKASDDGINIAGGNDTSGTMNFGDEFAALEDALLSINGGNIYINADGDGLDSNGSIQMTGGNVYVDGPTNDGNGALDYNGTFVLTGGILIAAGSSGMASAPSDSSTQSSILMTYSATQSANTTVSLTTKEGTSLIEYTPTKNYQSILISVPSLTTGSSYSLKTNDGTVDFETVTSVTWLNESGVTTAKQGFGGPNGGGGRGDKPNSDEQMGDIPHGEMPDGGTPPDGMPNGGTPPGGTPPSGDGFNQTIPIEDPTNN